MDIGLFFKALLIGFSIAAPVGPIGILCIHNTLTEGRVWGLVSGLGAATADAVYGSIAGFGLVLISEFLIRQQLWLHLFGGSFLCYLGVKTFFKQPTKQAAASNGKGLIGIYVSTFALTLTNPVTILSFVAIFAWLGLTDAEGNYTSAWILVSGVFCGSALWWLFLSSGVGFFRERFTRNSLGWVNKISGMLITAFGILAFLSAG